MRPSMDFLGIGSLVKGILSPVSEGYKARQEAKARIKEAEVNMKIAKLNAEATRYTKMAEIESDWDIEAQRQSQFSWKDEYLTLILTFPLIGAFIPGVQDYVLRGFEYLAKVPAWYITAFLGIVAASFGLRWWFVRKGI